METDHHGKPEQPSWDASLYPILQLSYFIIARAPHACPLFHAYHHLLLLLDTPRSRKVYGFCLLQTSLECSHCPQRHAMTLAPKPPPAPTNAVCWTKGFSSIIQALPTAGSPRNRQ